MAINKIKIWTQMVFGYLVQKQTKIRTLTLLDIITLSFNVNL